VARSQQLDFAQFAPRLPVGRDSSEARAKPR
jgi:hypothetical protein